MKFPEVISYMEIRIACYVYFQGKNLIERLHVTAAVQNIGSQTDTYREEGMTNSPRADKPNAICFLAGGV